MEIHSMGSSRGLWSYGYAVSGTTSECYVVALLFLLFERKWSTDILKAQNTKKSHRAHTKIPFVMESWRQTHRPPVIERYRTVIVWFVPRISSSTNWTIQMFKIPFITTGGLLVTTKSCFSWRMGEKRNPWIACVSCFYSLDILSTHTMNARLVRQPISRRMRATGNHSDECSDHRNILQISKHCRYELTKEQKGSKSL